jgi:hypothetical protein
LEVLAGVGDDAATVRASGTLVHVIGLRGLVGDHPGIMHSDVRKFQVLLNRELRERVTGDGNETKEQAD